MSWIESLNVVEWPGIVFSLKSRLPRSPLGVFLPVRLLRLRGRPLVRNAGGVGNLYDLIKLVQCGVQL